MTKRKFEIIAARLNEAFRDELKTVFREKFDIEIESNFSLLAMCLITTRVDKKDFTEKELAFLIAYSAGYEKAMSIVSE